MTAQENSICEHVQSQDLEGEDLAFLSVVVFFLLKLSI